MIKVIKKKLLWLGSGMTLLIMVILIVQMKTQISKNRIEERKENTIDETVQRKTDTDQLKNVWVLESTPDSITVLDGNTHRSFQVDTKEAILANQFVDLSYKENEVKEIRIKKDWIQGRVLSIDETTIEIEGYGKLPLEESLKIYKTYGEISELKKEELLVGTEDAKFYVGEGKVCGIILPVEYQPQNIRIVLKTNQFESLYHKSITFVSTVPALLTYGDQQVEVAAEEEFTIDEHSPYLQEGSVKIQRKEEGVIEIRSLKRAQGVPAYRGVIEIERREEGLLLRNDLSLEEYLYQVVPSEMPLSYDMEALKTQAICARSYAYRQMMKNSMAAYGAQVDDSVTFQVYNNSVSDERARKAVDDTRGQVVTYEGEVVETYYFSTSYGYTSTDEVWKAQKESLPYLHSSVLALDLPVMAMEKEETFESVIKNKDFQAFDSQEPWFRWETTLSAKKISETLNRKLRSRYQAGTANIQVEQGDGSFVSEPISEIGEVKKIWIEQRSDGGAVKTLRIEGTKHKIKVFSEYNVRAFLSPKEVDIVRKDGSIVSGSDLLPSAYITIEEKDTNQWLITGGGYGHGVGMSQNAAKVMAEKGMKCEEILKFFYKDIEIRKLE